MEEDILKKEIDYKKELEKDYARWNDVYTNGCNDPSWADGVNLNLIRNHIIADKRKLKETFSEDELPELYFQELPPEVSSSYMAKPNEIMAAATAYYEACTSSEEWDQLLNAFDFLDENDPKQKSMRFFIQRIKALKKAIDSKDYVWMQRFKDPTESLKMVKEYAKGLNELELNESIQMSLF